MAMRSAASVAEQLECCIEREPPLPAVAAAASLQREAFRVGFASALVLPIMGQL